MLLKKSNECPLCYKPMERLIDLPSYPLTELYEPWSETFQKGRGLADQGFLYCEPCNHGKLETIIQPERLYGEGYRTKSAASIGSRTALKNFHAFIGEVSADVVIDIGGNDASLVSMFHVARKVIIDPNASGEAECIRQFIEDVDLETVFHPTLPERKLILSSHTIEHIEKVDAFIAKVAKMLFHGDVLALQFPSLELLVKDFRMEQIHHQHIHYFSLLSIGELLHRYGIEITRFQFDHDHYGALMLMCRKGTMGIDGEKVTGSMIIEAEEKFHWAMQSLKLALKGKTFVAFGAALMLPVLAYYLPELAGAEYVADNNPEKNGLRYVNLDLRITNDYDLKGKDVLITAINTKLAQRELVKLAFQDGARNVIVPTHCL